MPYDSVVTALIEIRDLVIHYAAGHGSPVVAADEVSLEVEEGEVVGLLGESGCGKTTLLLAVLGLLLPPARGGRGSLRFRGPAPLARGDLEQRRPRGSGTSSSFQEPPLALNPLRQARAQRAEVDAA